MSPITHAHHSAVADDPSADIRPSHWNAAHTAPTLAEVLAEGADADGATITGLGAPSDPSDAARLADVGGGLAQYGNGSDGDVTIAATDEYIWEPDTAYDLDDIGAPWKAPNGHRFKVTTAGISGSTEPTWDTGPGATTADGTVVWTEDGEAVLVANRLQRDAYFRDITVEDGIDLETGNFVLRARGTVTFEGTAGVICNDGARRDWTGAGGGTLGGASHGGTEVADQVLAGDRGTGGRRFRPVVIGGAGGDAPGQSGGSGESLDEYGFENYNFVDVPVVALPSWLTDPMVYSGWFSAFVRGVNVQRVATNDPVEYDYYGFSQGVADYSWGGAPGGSGGNSTGAGTTSGRGGAGGGLLVACLRAIVGTGIIRAAGGEGFDAEGVGIAGGGGGGAGGTIILLTRSLPDTVTVTAPGGPGGAGIGVGGLSGASGDDGIIAVILD